MQKMNFIMKKALDIVVKKFLFVTTFMKRPFKKVLRILWHDFSKQSRDDWWKFQSSKRIPWTNQFEIRCPFCSHKKIYNANVIPVRDQFLKKKKEKAVIKKYIYHIFFLLE